MEQNHNPLKIIIIGDSEVGKTSLITRFVEDNFHRKYIPVKK